MWNNKLKLAITIILVVAALGGGAWYWKTRSNPNIQEGQSGYENSSYDLEIRIKDINVSKNTINGTRLTGIKAGQQMELIISNTGFYDKNRKVVAVSYFRPGMAISARGYSKIKEPNIFYADTIEEYILVPGFYDERY